jgi:2-oxoglutarate dehydrogenase E1 component
MEKKQSDQDFSYANILNISYLEEMYAQYLKTPETIEPSWRHFFEGMRFAETRLPKRGVGHGVSPELRVYHLIEAYRVYGHLLATFNPLAVHPPEQVEELSLKKHGFEEKDLSALFPTCGFLKKDEAPLQEIVDALQKTYCQRIGIEYMGFGDSSIEKWLQQRIEPYFEMRLNEKDKKMILNYLNKAELLESFLHTKFVGQKRFSLEGEETLIPMLAEIIDSGAKLGMEEVILGMAHRGRLNVLANILNKSYAQIFHEFEDHYTPFVEGAGDVKYHKGFDGNLETSTEKRIKVAVIANPSHLEAVDAVIEGATRAKQERRGIKEHRADIVPILIHGDASISGQGVVYETLELASLHGYSTGGTLHIVVNNQIGFTTLPKDARSTRYCTDLAKTIGAPIFHVNAEDPEGCVAVAKIAIEMRQKFQCDVFIDLNGYRKYGHNEGDEPIFTQPLEYQVIKEKKSIRELYRDQLIAEKVLAPAEAEQLETAFKDNLNQALESIRVTPPAQTQEKKEREVPSAPIKTAVDAPLLREIAEKFSVIPQGFSLHPKIERLVKERLAMLQADPKQPTIDWGMAEHLAFATLLWEGIHVRLSGQDSRRGTFSHRHAIWIDQKNAEKYFPLSHLKQGQGLFDVFNSPLSEYAVLGFEFGYTLFYPDALVIWEAQFGDFVNGGQIVVDQFIASSEQKWNQSSNLVLMLPHGYEGQGPEHSSGRMERFLQLCGDDNMRVVNCTTPAQLFHILRRQAKSSVKKPLILFTPKALLRHPQMISPLEQFTAGSFQDILDDPLQPTHVKRLFFCQGKVFYDLVAEREKRKENLFAFIRIEQLYPLNEQKIKEIVQKYNPEALFWVQEEHRNMGAWSYIHPLLEQILDKKITYIGRAQSASTAAGSYALHKKQWQTLINEVFS